MISIPALDVRELEKYLRSLFKGPATILNVSGLGLAEKKSTAALKAFGYGKPFMLTVRLAGKTRQLVLASMSANSFGHDFLADRAQNLLLSHETFGRLPKHVKSVDVGAFTHSGGMKSIGDSVEFFQLVEKTEGQEYFKDLEKLSALATSSKLDLDRCSSLNAYLARIHKKKHRDRSLWLRRIRDLIGHGECIMGLIDNYPEELDFTDEKELARIEEKCVSWRWRLKHRWDRLCQVHGDFHPWNILFRRGTDFSVLDRSRGEWGEAADDVAALTINYLFFSLRAHGRLEGPFENLFNRFLTGYLQSTDDTDLFRVIQPFYAWRALVVASPIWYPQLTFDLRRKLFNFVHNVLDSEFFDYKRVNSYFSR